MSPPGSAGSATSGSQVRAVGVSVADVERGRPRIDVGAAALRRVRIVSHDRQAGRHDVLLDRDGHGGLRGGNTIGDLEHDRMNAGAQQDDRGRAGRDLDAVQEPREVEQVVVRVERGRAVQLHGHAGPGQHAAERDIAGHRQRARVPLHGDRDAVLHAAVLRHHRGDSGPEGDQGAIAGDRVPLRVEVVAVEVVVAGPPRGIVLESDGGDRAVREATLLADHVDEEVVIDETERRRRTGGRCQDIARRELLAVHHHVEAVDVEDLAGRGLPAQPAAAGADHRVAGHRGRRQLDGRAGHVVDVARLQR